MLNTITVMVTGKGNGNGNGALATNQENPQW